MSINKFIYVFRVTYFVFFKNKLKIFSNLFHITKEVINFFRLLTKLCTDTEVKDMSKEKCKGFTVYPPSAFYPIPWRKWNYYFDEEHVKDVLNSLNDTIAIHVWNKHSVNKKIKIGSNVPYEILAKKFCPRTYAAVETVF